MEQHRKPQAVEIELAMFAHREWQEALKQEGQEALDQEPEAALNRGREAALKRGREAGLPPREYELLKLLVEKPDISSRDAGEALGITPGTVRALKSRIRRSLGDVA